MSISRRKSSLCQTNDIEKKLKEKEETIEIPIKKKVRIESTLKIAQPFADIISSDEEDDEDDSNYILSGIRSKFIDKDPDLDSPIIIKRQENNEDSQLF